MIFVTGCARSGTSLITSILQAHGCYLGVNERINRLFENVSIRENILKPYLIRCDADPLGQDVLPDTDHLPSFYGDLAKEVYAYLPRVPRAYKDAKLTLVWPTFHTAFNHATWVLVRRDKAKIVESCMRTDFMRKRSTVLKWEQWVDEHEKRFERMREELKIIEVWTDDVIANSYTFEPIAKFCGLPFSVGSTERMIDPKRWHNAHSVALEEVPKRAARA